MSLPYDPTLPKNLKKTQQWFASIITRPLLDESKMQLKSPSGILMEEEVPQFIRPSPTMQPHERIELYNQQYWWRLLSALHETYPLVTRLFGFYQFNQEIAIPYLTAYPPQHWSLSDLGTRLPKWIEESYQAKDKKLILASAQIDWAFNEGFTIGELPPMTAKDLPANGDLSQLLDKKLTLQPHIHLFKLDYDLFTFREAFIKEEGDYWIDHDFPKLPQEKDYHIILYRTVGNNAGWKEITAGEYTFLSFFKQGMSIEEACEQLENCSEEIVQEAMTNLHKWFQEWTVRSWLV